MNAQKRAPLAALSAPREKCFHFLFDNADVVIDGMLQQQRARLLTNSDQKQCLVILLQAVPVYLIHQQLPNMQQGL